MSSDYEEGESDEARRQDVNYLPVATTTMQTLGVVPVALRRSSASSVLKASMGANYKFRPGQLAMETSVWDIGHSFCPRAKPAPVRTGQRLVPRRNWSHLNPFSHLKNR
jgi:hypothetical protein